MFEAPTRVALAASKIVLNHLQTSATMTSQGKGSRGTLLSQTDFDK